MRESGYQRKLIKAIEAMGGWAVNGNFTKDGEADLQCGFPVNGRLHYLALEVKSEKEYHRVMKCVDLVKGEYVLNGNKGLKKHEPLQIEKINMVRSRGGLALVAWNINQVKEYVNDSIKHDNSSE